MPDARTRRWIMVDIALTQKPAFRKLRKTLKASTPELVGWVVLLWSYCEGVSRRTFDDAEDLAEAAGVPFELLGGLASVGWVRKAKGGPNGSRLTVRLWDNSRGEVSESVGIGAGSVDIGAGSVPDRPPDRGAQVPAKEIRRDKTSRDELTRDEARREDGEGEGLSISEWVKSQGHNSLTDCIDSQRKKG